jgi:LuxR family transcriptional regulator, maltose regulon positive regulatory protein
MHLMQHNPPPCKLSTPRLSPFQLPRPQLVERMGEAEDVRLILLRAPAGFGKTTAMLQLAERQATAGVVVGWLNLDASDNDLGRFVAHFDAAVASVAPRIDAVSAESGLLELIDRVAAATTRFTLFLDDFEAIESSTVLDLIRQIVDNLPRAWQLVIGSRIVPGLGLGRLRARGQLLEIGVGHLRFSPAETATFLRERRCLPLSNSALDRLQQATDGWATALWLASLALESHDDPEAFLDTFSGAHAAITEFLAEDVLARLPHAQREFLLSTSVLQQLNPPLCDALLTHTGSGTMLVQLERANLFLVALDRPDHYRYHSLFREFLLGQLAQRDPDSIPVLHRRASQWYEDQGRAVPAIDHALVARDYDRATRLLATHAQRLLDVGRFRLLARWLDSVPKPMRDRHPRLRVAHAWALMYTHRYTDAVALVQLIDETIRAGREEWDDELQAHMLAMRPIAMIMTDRRDGLAIGMANHAQVNPRYGFPYSLLTNMMAFLYAGLDRHEEARAMLDQARRSHVEIGSTFNQVAAEAIEGTISLRQGKLQDAIARFRAAMNNMAGDSVGRSGGNAPAAVQYAEALYEAGQLDQAEHVLTIYMGLARELGTVDHVLRGHLIRSRLAWQRGEPDRAFGLLGELEYIGHQDNIARLVVSAELERSRLAVVRGDVAAAAVYLRRAENPVLWCPEDVIPISLHEVETLEMGRLRLRSHTAAADVLDDLRTAIDDALARRRHRAALQLTLLMAAALQRTGRRDAARECIAQALSRACVEGIVQPFADEGPVVAALALHWSRSIQSGGKIPAGAISGYIERLELACASAAGDAEDETDAPAIRAGGRGEALTDREIHVLKLVAQGKSNAALAQELFVSENTVRTHLRNISSKLDTRNRTEAVARARQQGLIR